MMTFAIIHWQQIIAKKILRSGTLMTCEKHLFYYHILF